MRGRRQRFPWRRALVLAAVACAVQVPSEAQTALESAASSPPELKVSVAAVPAKTLGKAAERWAAGITEAGRGALVAKLHPGATLAGRDPARELLALAEGRADLAVGSALQWSTQLAALAVFALPWLAPENRDIVALADDAALRAALGKRLDAMGVVLVALAPLGYREIATTSRPIRAPDDLAGLRLRIAAVPLLQEVLAGLGAVPQAMPYAQAQAAFASGALDGQVGLPAALAASRASAFGPKHLGDWGAFADVMVFAVRKNLWEGWSASRRESVVRAAESAMRDADALGREARAVEELARKGVAVLRVTPAGHAAFRAAARGVAARWREAIGTDIVELAERAVVSGAARSDARGVPRQ